MTNSSILYLRTAQASDARVDEQEASLKAFAAERGYTVSEVFRDNGKSGARTVGRDGLLNALGYIKEHLNVRALIVQDTDRLARNASDHFAIRAFLKKHNVTLLPVNQPFIDSSPEGELFASIIAGVNAFQSRMHGNRVKEGLRRKKMAKAK